MQEYTKQGSRLVQTVVARIMRENPGVEELEAYQMYKQEMRDRGSMGGKKSTSRPFRDTPGLAKRAINKRHGNVQTD